jgi:sialate O-acetylesterase
MERQLGLRPGQQSIVDWEREVAAANYPKIRQLFVPQAKSFTLLAAVKGNWTVCSPTTLKDFAVVGYFCAICLPRATFRLGTCIARGAGRRRRRGRVRRRWKNYRTLPSRSHSWKKFAADPEIARRETLAKQEAWYQRVDSGSKPGAAWSAAELNAGDWKTMTLPAYWESAGYPNFDGIFWFRRVFELPGNWDGADVTLYLGR